MPLFRWLPLFTTLLWLTLPALDTQAQPSNPATACPQPALSRVQKHLVAFGETLESIARQYDLMPATLIGMNPALRSGEVRVGSEVLIPPYNGIRVQVPANQTWRDVAATYKIREDVLFEINGCQENPRVVFVPGVNWSPESSERSVQGDLAGYPLPAMATVAFGYGWQLHPTTRKVVYHSGVDLRAAIGTPVLAAGEGTVAFAGQQGNYGNLVVINHREGKQTRYAHLASISVTTGQKIKQGERLGTVGSTGTPDIQETHLHFEVRYNSDLGWVAENPEPYLRNAKVANNRN